MMIRQLIRENIDEKMEKMVHNYMDQNFEISPTYSGELDFKAKDGGIHLVGSRYPKSLDVINHLKDVFGISTMDAHHYINSYYQERIGKYEDFLSKTFKPDGNGFYNSKTEQGVYSHNITKTLLQKFPELDREHAENIVWKWESNHEESDKGIRGRFAVKKYIPTIEKLVQLKTDPAIGKMLHIDGFNEPVPFKYISMARDPLVTAASKKLNLPPDDDGLKQAVSKFLQDLSHEEDYVEGGKEEMYRYLQTHFPIAVKRTVDLSNVEGKYGHIGKYTIKDNLDDNDLVFDILMDELTKRFKKTNPRYLKKFIHRYLKGE